MKATKKEKHKNNTKIIRKQKKKSTKKKHKNVKKATNK